MDDDWPMTYTSEDMDRIYKQAYRRGREDEQAWVEKRCTEVGIDYTLIFTCEKGEN